MLTKAQKIILYLSAIAALLLGVVLIIPFRTYPGVTIETGKTVLIIELLVKSALLLPFLGLSVYPCILKYKQIAGLFERSRVVNVISYLPLAIYVSGLLILNINILSYNQEVFPPALWTLSFTVQLFDVAFIIVGFVLLPKFLMKLNKKLTVIFDVAVGIIAVATLVITILLSVTYFNAFGNSYKYFGTAAPYGPVLFFTYLLALVAFVTIAILTYRMVRKDETELYINFDLQREQLSDVKALAYNEAYNDILDEFEEYFEENLYEEEYEEEAEEETEEVVEETEEVEEEPTAEVKQVEKEVVVVKDEEDAKRIAELEAQLAELHESHSETLEDLQDDIEDAEEEAEAAKAQAEQAKVAAEAARSEAEIAKAEAEAIKAEAAAKAAEEKAAAEAEVAKAKAEEEAAAAAKAQLETTGKAPKVKAPAEKRDVQVYFRLPSVCTVTIKNGVELLLQSRVPVYQLGKESSLPVNVILK